MKQDRRVPQYRQLALQLLRISPQLYELYQEQWEIVGNLTAQNLIKLDRQQQRIILVNSLFYIQLSLPQDIQNDTNRLLAQPFFYDQHLKSESLEDFFLQDIYFLTGDLKPQHSLFLREKAQQLRRLLIEQVYEWVNGPVRIAEFLKQLSVAEADMIDQALIAAEYYTEPLLKNCIQQSSELPTELLHLLQQLFSLEYLAPADFLPLQNLMH